MTSWLIRMAIRMAIWAPSCLLCPRPPKNWQRLPLRVRAARMSQSARMWIHSEWIRLVLMFYRARSMRLKSIANGAGAASASTAKKPSARVRIYSECIRIYADVSSLSRPGSWRWWWVLCEAQHVHGLRGGWWGVMHSKCIQRDG